MSRFAAGICGIAARNGSPRSPIRAFLQLGVRQSAVRIFFAGDEDPTSADAYNHIAQTIFIGNVSRRNAFQRFIGGTKFVHQPKLPLSEAEPRSSGCSESFFHVCQERIAANPNILRRFIRKA